MSTKNITPEKENTTSPENKASETAKESDTARETETTAAEREPLAEFHSPAAKLAHAAGEKTMRITIRERHDKDEFRHICVGNNPPAKLPTEVEVEVVPEEYYALKNSMDQRQENKKEKKRLQREFEARSKYLK